MLLSHKLDFKTENTTGEKDKHVKIRVNLSIQIDVPAPNSFNINEGKTDRSERKN